MSSKPSTQFPDAQLARIKEFIPEYLKVITQDNPKLESRSMALSKWRDETAKKLMKEELFQGLLTSSGLEYKKWADVSRTSFISFPVLVY